MAKETILVVDDERNIVELAQMYLEQAGYRVDSASDGQEALTRFYALHIMLIPAAIVLLTSLHLWRVRKDGGLAAQASSEVDKE